VDAGYRAVMNHQESLPIADFDHLPLGSLETHLRSLDRPGLATLIEHENHHGRRAPVLNLLRQRLEALDGGAEPAPGAADPGSSPEVQPADTGSEKASPQTQGPPVNPPSQGVPTNPAQPRR
jgi:hypothetical protein